MANKEDSWSVLRHLSSQFNLSWVCIGDFNEITKLSEKLGGALRPEYQMQNFSDCLDVCGLKDLGYSGLPYTWCNRRFGGQVVWVRLDRALATPDWLLKFPTARLYHLSMLSSDHKPIWLCLDDIRNWFFRPGKPFRFKAMWLKDVKCEGFVHSAWEEVVGGDSMGKVIKKVENCQAQLQLWDRNVFGNVRRALARKIKELEKAEVDSMVGRESIRLQVISNDIKKLMDLEECMWNQHSKVDWLEHGDLNTKYFHCRATERNKRNLILGIENEYGNWVEDENRIGDILTSYFSSLFTSVNPNVLEPVLKGVNPRVSMTINEELLRPFMAEEASLALKQMDADTTPGPDGLPPLFYKQFWDKVGGEVTEAVLSTLNSSTIPKTINHTFLTLIPKI